MKAKTANVPTDPAGTCAALVEAVTSLGYRVESAEPGLVKFQSSRSWRVSHGLDVTAAILPAPGGAQVTMTSRVAKPGTPFGSGRSVAGALGEDGAVYAKVLGEMGA